MPSYDYKCNSKGCRWKGEMFHGFDVTSPPCPKCGNALQQIFNVPGITFKGKGFYSTDYPRGRTRPRRKKNG